MNFSKMFKEATGNQPFPYQQRMAEAEEFPSLLEVPTGAGKTAAAILGWLWRRRFASDEVRQVTPRRLVYCLPMRVLVEQTRDCAVRWLHNLGLLGGSEGSVRNPLLKSYEPFPDEKKDGNDADHIRVYLLMGGDVDRDWDMYPERDAILIGTQDMLLSRALNRGYAMSRYRWPVQFGLLNNDCLWVMDEVQLMGPGLWTSAQLDWMRTDRFRALLPCHTLWMSATNSGGFLDTIDRRRSKRRQPDPFPFQSTELPETLRNAQRPIELWLSPATKTQKKRKMKSGAPNDSEFMTALAHSISKKHIPGTLTLVVCNKIKTAQAIFKATNGCNRGGADLVLLTSRFRKTDRTANTDKLLVFEQERKDSKEKRLSDHPGLICVATQVVEAGIDISAYQLWSEIAPWPSLLQRLGRLNRDGRANGEARAYLFEFPLSKSKDKQERAKGPYAPGDIDLGRWLAKELAEIYKANGYFSTERALQALCGLQGAKEKLSKSLDPKPEPFPRAIDVHGLFSTEPDIFGGFTDVSQYVRGADENADLTVFWREFNPAKRLPLSDELAGPGYSPDEGCTVPVYRFRELLKEGGGAWVWEEKKEKWEKVRQKGLSPGMVVMVPRSIGGYDDQLGWTGDKEDHLSDVPPPGPFGGRFDVDPRSESGCWVNVKTHLEDSARIATSIVQKLRLATSHPCLAESVTVGAMFHDIGKTHPKWQGALPEPSPKPDIFWAKAPFLLAVQPGADGFSPEMAEDVMKRSGISYLRSPTSSDPRDSSRFLWQTDRRVVDSRTAQPRAELESLPGNPRVWMVPFRPGLRHEAVSALAMWHQYFRKSANFPALAVYLAAAHHGKTRTVLRARNASGDDVCGIPRDSGLLPWDGGLPLDFDCAMDGCSGCFTSDGNEFVHEAPGWTALMADLLGGWEGSLGHYHLAIRDGSEPSCLGPFVLAFLEALVRCADARASSEPSRAIPVGGEQR